VAGEYLKKKKRSSAYGVKNMKDYDYLIIGGGTAGLAIMFNAVSTQAKVALIEKGLIGGTCHNVGCVPSKMLIYPADLILTIRKAAKLGIMAEISNIDFGSIIKRMRQYVDDGREKLEEMVMTIRNLDRYSEEGHFVDDYTVEAGGERIRAKKIFIASGSRNQIPPVRGIESVDYLTNESLLNLDQKPESMIIIGGGYVAVEYGHFFASVGTKVTIVEEGNRLVSHEEPEISYLLKEEILKRMQVHTEIHATEVRKDRGGCVVNGKHRETGNKLEFTAERVLIATGRQSNADLLKVENSGIDTDGKNYIKVDEYLETTKENIWAVGDAINKLMFTHSGDREAEIAWHNSMNDKKRKMDFNTVPHAIYTQPTIAAVGMTEEQAGKDHEILVGVARYSDIVQGDVMMEESGFAKAIVEKGTEKILGFHIIGPHAQILIQEVTNVMARGGSINDIRTGMHIFPSLSELIPEALRNLKEVSPIRDNS